MDDEHAHVRSELLVEEVLEVEGPRPCHRVGWAQGRLGKAPLERVDDPGRIPDRLLLENQHREGPVTGELLRDRPVPSRDGCATNVRDALVVERPPHLLVVVRDLEVPEDRRHVHLRTIHAADAYRGLLHCRRIRTHERSATPTLGA